MLTTKIIILHFPCNHTDLKQLHSNRSALQEAWRSVCCSSFTQSQTANYTTDVEHVFILCFL